MKKFSAMSVYIVVGNLAWMVISPLVLFIGGGGWLVRRYNWDERIMTLFVALGLITMAIGFAAYVKQLIKMYGDVSPPDTKQSSLKYDKQDYDY
jgi:hypothetical protein